MKIKGRKVLKAKGGADASKADFNTPSKNVGSDHSHSRFETGSGYYGETPTNTGNNTTGNATGNVKTNQTTTGGGFKIPVIGPLTAGLRIIQSLTTGQKKTKHPFSANTIKQTKQNVVPPLGGGNEGPQLCPDGTYPPCKTPETQIKSPAQKNMFLSDFKAYDEGGEVVISSNVDKSLL